MSLKESDLIKIINNRDPAYDGRFYFGVKTTKIYCRPVCPAKPLEKNILLFKSPTEAEKNGYRACKRCRPDLFPGQRLVDEKYVILSYALDLIDEFPEWETVEELAGKLAISSRHLRRLFHDYLGATPNEVMTTRRLHLAKKFLLETHYKIIDIAFAVGFKSLRRFNESFKERYGEAPSSFRKKDNAKKMKECTLIRQFVRKPYHWDYVLDYLDRHLIYGQEEVREGRYIKFFENSGKVEVCYSQSASCLEYRFFDLSLKEIRENLPKLNQLLDTKSLPTFLPLKSGIRVPASYEPFETAVSIIIGQLISTAQAKERVKKLIEAFGRDKKYFPLPHQLMNEELEKIGITRVKASAIRELARLVHEKEISFDNYLLKDEIKEKLLMIKGIGPWTVEMISMRCLSDIDAFPKTDLIVKRVLDKGIVDESKWIGRRAYLCHFIWEKYGKEKTK